MNESLDDRRWLVREESVGICKFSVGALLAATKEGSEASSLRMSVALRRSVTMTMIILG